MISCLFRPRRASQNDELSGAVCEDGGPDFKPYRTQGNPSSYLGPDLHGGPGSLALHRVRHRFPLEDDPKRLFILGEWYPSLCDAQVLKAEVIGLRVENSGALAP
jgi:hypothetical protein